MSVLRDLVRFAWRIAVIAFFTGLIIGLVLGFRMGATTVPLLIWAVPHV
jgi:uncharacterized membrane-anchored protein YhcB (DUF1043 family)